MTAHRIHSLLALLAALSLCATAGAQEDQKSWKLEPSEMEGVEHGKVAIVKGEASARGDRFFLEHLNVMQPVAVYLLSEQGSDDLGLELAKYNWQQPLRQARTSDGFAVEELRTEGELRITVKALDEPEPYHLVVLAGNEVRPPMPQVTVVAGEGDVDGADGGGVPWMMVIIALLLGGILVVLVMMLRKKS